MDRQVSIDIGKAIGEVVAIDWRDRNGGWTNYIRIRFKIDVLRPLRKVVHLVSSEDGDGEENDLTMLKGKEKSRAGEEEFESFSPAEKHPTKLAGDGGGKMRMKNQIPELVERIDKLIDVPNSDCNADMLKTTYFKLGHLYDKEECYC
ncbi:hypothetical protein GOBAR_DD21449 [Gossypium barbadense]|nr:hypothetical protein GOBAR_DD21449 [Gossypium barbadense]